MGPLIVAILLGAIAVFFMAPVLADFFKEGVIKEAVLWWPRSSTISDL